MGILYLIQPAELVGTDRYKIGCSTKSTLERVKNGYKKGTEVLQVIDCDNPFETEKILKKKFSEKFKLIAGNEYFEGDREEMKKIFYSVVMSHSNDAEHENDVSDNSDENEEYDKYHMYRTNDKYHVVETYEEWIKLTNIARVIITNKNGEGYLRFNGQLWFKLYDRYCDTEYVENLYGWIEKSRRPPYMITDTGRHISLIYDTEKIYKDIINKCYINKNKIIHYNLKYSEYEIYLENSETGKSTEYILNTKNIKFIKPDELIHDKILIERLDRMKINKGDFKLFNPDKLIDGKVNIIDGILDSLINYETKQQYKTLLYNIFVEQNKENIIFYDYNEQPLTYWLTCLMKTVIREDSYISSDEYSNDKKSFLRKLKTGKVRCLVLYSKSNHKKNVDKEISVYLKMGIKNIIVVQINKEKQMYRIENCREYLQKNKKYILDFCNGRHKTPNINEYQFDDSFKYSVYEIFDYYRLLKSTFFLWACAK